MGEWVEQFALGQGGHLRVIQQAGGIRIKGVPGEQATVKATWPGTAELADKLHLSHRPGVLEVEVQAESHGWFGFHTDRNPVDLLIEVPLGTVCSIETGSGPTEVVGTGAGVRLDAGSGPILLRQVGKVELDGGSGQVLVEQAVGDLHLNLGSGPLVVRQVSGAVTIDAGSGNLLLEAVEGPVRMDVGSGRVEIRGCRGPELRIDAGSGELRLYDLAVQNLTAETGSGRLLVDLAEVAPTGRYQIETGSGGVTVQVPADANLDLDLDYEGGRLEFSGLPVEVIEQERGQMRGRLGHGGARLGIETHGGIRLQPRSGESIPPGGRCTERQTVVAAEAASWDESATRAMREGERAMREHERAMREHERAMRDDERAMRDDERAMRDDERAMCEADLADAETADRDASSTQTLEEILGLVAKGELSPEEADLLIGRLGK